MWNRNFWPIKLFFCSLIKNSFRLRALAIKNLELPGFWNLKWFDQQQIRGKYAWGNYEIKLQECAIPAPLLCTSSQKNRALVLLLYFSNIVMICLKAWFSASGYLKRWCLGRVLLSPSSSSSWLSSSSSTSSSSSSTSADEWVDWM